MSVPFEPSPSIDERLKDIERRLLAIEDRFTPTCKPATVNLAPAEVKVYRSVPTEIRAMQWTGENAEAINNWTGVFRFDGLGYAELWIDANHAWLDIEIGEWVAQDQHGFYPIKDDLFQMKYREVN